MTGNVRWAGRCAVLYSVLIPTVELWRYGLEAANPARTAAGVLTVAAYLPLHLRHVRNAATGDRPRFAGWTLSAMAVVIVAALPFLGAYWLGQFHALAVSVLLVVPAPWSFVLFAAIVVVQSPLAALLGAAQMAPFFTVACALKALPVFLLIWLLGATRTLHAAQLALAGRAVARERLRIDTDVRRTVGTALESLVVQGARASALAGRDPAAARVALGHLTAHSRRTLAESRRLVHSYQRTSLAADQHTAATLLGAAGIQCRIVHDAGDLDVVDERLQSALRADVARLLADESPGDSVITVSRIVGRLHLTTETENLRCTA